MSDLLIELPIDRLHAPVSEVLQRFAFGKTAESRFPLASSSVWKIAQCGSTIGGEGAEYCSEIDARSDARNAKARYLDRARFYSAYVRNQGGRKRDRVIESSHSRLKALLYQRLALYNDRIDLPISVNYINPFTSTDVRGCAILLKERNCEKIHVSRQEFRDGGEGVEVCSLQPR